MTTLTAAPALEPTIAMPVPTAPAPAASAPARPFPVAATTLATARFIDLVTFRRDGRPVGTPVLFVVDGERLLVRTAAGTGKLKRLAHTDRVEVAPSDQKGRRLGPAVAGRARVLGPEAVGPALARLHARYRIAGPLFTAVRRLRGQRDVIVEIDLDLDLDTEPTTGAAAPTAGPVR